MITKYLISIVFGLGLLLYGLMASQEKENNDNGSFPEKGFVPNEETAIKIAEAIWFPIYGKLIYNRRPYVAKLKDDSIWVVEGTLPKGYVGGVPYAEINKRDCKIVKVAHGK